MPPWSSEQLPGVVQRLLEQGCESEWVEFKRNNDDPEKIGEYISALANSAALKGQPTGFVVWGVDDKAQKPVGTTFKPGQTRKGNEGLENWLARQLAPGVDFCFHELEIDGKRLVLLEIPAADTQPVRFQSNEFVRVGSHKKKLKDHPEKERELWKVLERTTFEVGVAMQGLDMQGVLGLLDYSSYFSLLKLPLPTGPDLILGDLRRDRLVSRDLSGTYSILNLGAILFAKRLSDFSGVARKATRVIQYDGRGKLKALKERVFERGYASDFEALVEYVNGLLPANEVLGRALRKTVQMLPEIAVREVIANMLIHQDFSVRGAGPMIEVFEGRVEFTNPGTPLVQTDHFLNHAPRSRNEDLASLMRRMGVCEERGSGVDKIVYETESFQLPPPLFEVPGESTRATLYGHRPLTRMDKADRIRACYLHACLRFVSDESVTNATVRKRFDIAKGNSAAATRLIIEAVDAGVIGPKDPLAGKRQMSYVPHWALSSGGKITE